MPREVRCITQRRILDALAQRGTDPGKLTRDRPRQSGRARNVAIGVPTDPVVHPNGMQDHRSEPSDARAACQRDDRHSLP